MRPQRPSKFMKWPLSPSRFSSAESPALYLSSTVDAVQFEIGDQLKTIGEFDLKEDCELKIFDLTMLKIYTDANSVCSDIGNYQNYYGFRCNNPNDFHAHLLWPLLASCYMVKSPNVNDDCIEYKFPQLFSKYLKDNNICDGIRYFTVRNENLNPSEATMCDYVLFTRNYNSDGYDEKLMNNFIITIKILTETSTL